MHHGEDMIGEPRRVGVVLLDPQVRLVVQQSVEHVGRVADADVDHLGAEGRVLVGDVGVEEPAGLGTVLETIAAKEADYIRPVLLFQAEDVNGEANVET